MKYKALAKIKNSLEDVFKVLTDAGITDATLRHRYAEYLVASILSKRGYDVQLSSERKDTGADLYLTGQKTRIEVKSGKIKADGWTDASFGMGNQIKKKKFDYCVFVVFDKAVEGRVKATFIFTRDELREVTKPRKGIAKHLDTNPCVLLLAPSIQEYKKYMQDYKSQKLHIEYELNKNPRKYSEKWSKIK